MIKQFIKIFCVFALLSIILLKNLGASPTLNKQDYFNIVIPKGFRVQKESPVEDFELYTISKGNQSYVIIYIGNQPDFPKKIFSDSRQIVDVNTINRTIISEWKNNKLIGKQVKINLATPGGWPSSIHAWTTQIAPAKMMVAARILDSLSIR